MEKAQESDSNGVETVLKTAHLAFQTPVTFLRDWTGGEGMSWLVATLMRLPCFTDAMLCVHRLNGSDEPVMACDATVLRGRPC